MGTGTGFSRGIWSYLCLTNMKDILVVCRWASHVTHISVAKEIMLCLFRTHMHPHTHANENIY